MTFKYFNALVILVLTGLVGCRTTTFNSELQSSKNDTLTIGYLDTFLVGKQVFPLTAESSKFEDLVDNKILLAFESDDYYYCFYNRKKEIDILSYKYWNQRVPEYLNKKDGANLKSAKFLRVDYRDGPFLTGFYNLKDSIIVLTSELKKDRLENLSELQVSYVSTIDTENEDDGDGLITFDLKDILSELHIPNHFKQKGKYKIALMEATSLVDNAWYNAYPERYSEFSNVVVLSVIDNEIFQIQYLDSEYIDDVFKKKNIGTKDIHYN